MRVLLAEDTDALRHILTRTLEHYGHEVVAVTNGREAVDQFDRAEFDGVVLDIQMPELNGFEAARAIRERCARLPIIGMSDRIRDEQWMAAGMNSFLSKPVELATLLSLLVELSEQARRQSA